MVLAVALFDLCHSVVEGRGLTVGRGGEVAEPEGISDR